MMAVVALVVSVVAVLVPGVAAKRRHEERTPQLAQVIAGKRLARAAA